MKQEIPSSFRRKVKEVSQHEVGHWIISRVLGFRSGDISITFSSINGDYEGGSEVNILRPIITNEDLIDYLEKRTIILFAGVFAEYMQNNKVDKEKSLENLTVRALSDSSKINELIKLIWNVQYRNFTTEELVELELKEISDNIINKTIILVEQESQIIRGLGERLCSELKYIGESFILKEEEIINLPAIKERLERLN